VVGHDDYGGTAESFEPPDGYAGGGDGLGLAELVEDIRAGDVNPIGTGV
jgi:hypothetical protein